jgi:hypothetical protein
MICLEAGPYCHSFFLIASIPNWWRPAACQPALGQCGRSQLLKVIASRQRIVNDFLKQQEETP